MTLLNVAVIVVAAGSGSRFGYKRNKLFFPLWGKPVLQHTLSHVFQATLVTEVIIVYAECDYADIKKMVHELHPRQIVRYVLGGKEREDSVYQGLLATSETMDIVMVHDGSRPMAGPEYFDRAVPVMEQAEAAIYAIPVKDTIKQVSHTELYGTQEIQTLKRSQLIAAQTPQIFQRHILLQAHQYARKHHLSGTDDASLVEAMGKKIIVLPGDERNLKVTTREDITTLEASVPCKSIPRIGIGYDVHPLVEGKKLILGGVSIPFSHGLAGHSDADVLVHAVMDALLGAAGLADIGTYFPDTDQTLKGISSLLLLEKVREIISTCGYCIHNIDVMLLAQRPKLKEYIPQMIERIAIALRIDKTAISIKATTTEHLGFVGREEGMAAQAVAMIIKHNMK